jgi:hypothetical protein
LGQSLNQHEPNNKTNDIANNGDDFAIDHAHVDANVDANANNLGEEISPIFFKDSQRIVKLPRTVITKYNYWPGGAFHYLLM